MIFLDFFRRTARVREVCMIPQLTSEEWLAGWDANHVMHTVSMGGLGPGYEQCIQILAAEFLRSLLKNKPDLSDKKKWPDDRAQIEADADEVLQRLRPSGSQFGAAMSLATCFYLRGPTRCVEEVKSERRIQAQKEFPR